MKKENAYVEVTAFGTRDGMIHRTEHDAQEHAEDLAGRALDSLLSQITGLDSQMKYRLTCFMLERSREFAKALDILLPPDDTL